MLKQYFIHSKAWYSKNTPKEKGVVETISFGFYHPDGKIGNELHMEWEDFTAEWEQERTILPHLECYSDGWIALAQFGDIIKKLAQIYDDKITPQQFCELLENFGFVDATPLYDDGK
jgi:hypothetical protein